MTGRPRPRSLAAVAATALIAAGCGGGAGNGSASARSPIVVLMAKAPNSLDPAVGDTPEALEADWLVYTPLLTYAHAGGSPGTQLVPALAESLPGIADDGLVYSFTLIKGLTYSNGQPVRAGDFTRAVERAIKLWPQAAQLITSHIAGAAAFASGRARTISGITADDASGQITIHLSAPFGAFEDVLALPALAPVPAATPLSDEGPSPPPGVGPYRIARLTPGRSFSLVMTPDWPREGAQNVPAGHLDVDVRINPDAAGNARAVLGDTADVFDWPDQIPASMLGEISRRASGRYSTQTTDATSVIFLNASTKPFSSQLAREAVRAGLDQATLAGLDPGRLATGCYVLPPKVFGHPQAPCPYGAAKTLNGDLARAKALISRSGMVGTRVAVWSERGAPVRQWMAYYASLLDRIGLRASLRYGVPAGDPQTGYTGVDQVLPNPVYFYDQLIGPASQGKIYSPHVTTTVHELAGVPGSTVGGVGSFWRQLEVYVANRVYVAVLGYPTFPEFFASRVDARAVVFSPFAGIDWSSLRFK